MTVVNRPTADALALNKLMKITTWSNQAHKKVRETAGNLALENQPIINLNFKNYEN
jgi:hypothetical protein